MIGKTQSAFLNCLTMNRDDEEHDVGVPVAW